MQGLTNKSLNPNSQIEATNRFSKNLPGLTNKSLNPNSQTKDNRGFASFNHGRLAPVWYRTTPLPELHQIPRASSFVPKWPSDSTCNCKRNEQKNTLQVSSHFFQYFLKLWYGELYRQSCLNLYECSPNKLKYIIMRSFEISMKSTAFIPARQTDMSESVWVLTE